MSTQIDPNTAALAVRADEDSEIFVLDADLQRRAYAVGVLRERLPKGIYKLRVVRGGAVVERIVELSADDHVELRTAPAVPIAPIARAAGDHAREIEALAEAAIAAGPGRRAAPAILVLVHRDGAETPDPLASLTLSRWLRMDERRRPSSDYPHAQIGERHWSAWAAGLQPGCHQLELGRGALRQAVMVAPGHQTRIFIRRRRRTEVSIQLAHPGARIVYDHEGETVEVARRAMETERPIFVAQSLVTRMLHDKWDNPLMGVVGAHLFLAALEREQKTTAEPRTGGLDDDVRRRAPDTLHEVLRNLEKLLWRPDGELPSDLIALHLRALPFTGNHRAFGKVREPPLFWASWRTLLAHSVPGGAVALTRALWSRVSQAFKSGPYLAWRPGRVSIDAAVEQLVDDVLQRSSSRDRIGLEKMALRAGDGGGVTPSREEIAAALGAPTSLLPRSGRGR